MYYTQIHYDTSFRYLNFVQKTEFIDKTDFQSSPSPSISRSCSILEKKLSSIVSRVGWFNLRAGYLYVARQEHVRLPEFLSQRRGEVLKPS